MPPFEEVLEKETMKYFAEIERMRHVSERNKQVYKKRDIDKEEEEKQIQKQQEEFNKSWTNENRTEARVGDWRNFEKAPAAKKAKTNASSFHIEKRSDGIKHGKVEIEGWKKNWK